LVLLPPDSPIPIAIRLGTSDAQQAHNTVRVAGVTVHDEELIRMEGAPAMFSFTDPDGNALVYLEDTRHSEPR
jgi:predicted enzyme related to lactoylglutathione lyase